MSQFVAELCALLLGDTYGEFFSHIFSILTQHNRLSLPDLARHCHLPQRHVRQGLSVLISARLAHHYTAPTGQTFYSACVETAYTLVRSGRALRTVEDRVGKYEAEVLVQVMLLGHAKVSNLATIPALVSPPAKGLSNGTGEHLSNGASNTASKVNDHSSPRTVDSLLSALEKLSEAGFIQKVRTAHFRNDADNRDDAERHVGSTQVMTNAKGKKMQEEFDAAVDRELERRKESVFPRSTFYSRSVSGIKRGADVSGDSYARKKAKMSNGVTEDTHEDQHDLGPVGTLILQVNHAKFTVLMRNQRLVAMVEQTIGRPTAKVYRAALRLIEQTTLQTRQKTAMLAPGEPSDYETPILDVDTLVREIDPAKIHLDGTVANWNPQQASTNGDTPQPVVRRRRPPDWDRDNSDDEGDADDHGNISGVDQDSADENGDRDFRPNRNRTNGTLTNGHISQYEKVLQHLHLLAEAPEEFITLEYDGPNPTWSINYQRLSAQIRDQQVFSIISDQFGPVALRLVRVLIEKGKLDEKAIQEVALMSAKDLRQVLAMLKAAGFLELQEVPRENQRQPSRTIYLWFYDSDRARRKVLEDTYKSMTRILQRLQVERKKIQGVLDKAERTDVKGHEEELLSSGELQALKAWRKLEESMWGELGRLDDLVTVLRDF